MSLSGTIHWGCGATRHSVPGALPGPCGFAAASSALRVPFSTPLPAWAVRLLSIAYDEGADGDSDTGTGAGAATGGASAGLATAVAAGGGRTGGDCASAGAGAVPVPSALVVADTMGAADSTPSAVPVASGECSNGDVACDFSAVVLPDEEGGAPLSVGADPAGNGAVAAAAAAAAAVSRRRRANRRT